MDVTTGRVGRFQTVGSAGWLFPTGAIALAGTALCLVILAVYAAFGSVMPCDVGGRIAATFLTAALTGGACLAAAAFTSAAGRTIGAVAGGVVAGGLAWWIVAAMFAARC